MRFADLQKERPRCRAEYFERLHGIIALPDISNLFSLTTKRVTDLVLEQSREVFRQSGIELDAKMTSIITLIHQAGEPLTSTTLAAKSGLSRQLVESRLRKLMSEGYLEEAPDPSDLRKRLYSISAQKGVDVARVLAVTAAIEDAYEALWAELGLDLQQALRDLESRLGAKPLLARLAELEPGHLQKERR
jgi:DNA-binding MarR family transcriptional regulator